MLPRPWTLRVAAWLMAGSITAALALTLDDSPALSPAGFPVVEDAEEAAVRGPHPRPQAAVPVPTAVQPPVQSPASDRAEYHIAASRGLAPGSRLVASWYGAECQGFETANGERFDRAVLSAAHRSLPFGTVVEVTNLLNGNSIQVRINDRGPWVEGREIDLSEAAFATIAPLNAGVIPIRLEVVDPQN